MNGKLHPREEKQKCSEGKQWKLKASGLIVVMVSKYLKRGGRADVHAGGVKEM